MFFMRIKKIIKMAIRRILHYKIDKLIFMFINKQLIKKSVLFDDDYYEQICPNLIDRKSLKSDYLRNISVSPHPLFDPVFYRQNNPKLSLIWFDPLVHFELKGYKQYCNPHPLFDLSYYQKCSDLAADGRTNPLVHYCDIGYKYNFDPHILFSSEYYINQLPPEKRCNINPLIHYLNIGWKEGISPSPLFDIYFYLNQNDNLKNLEIDPLSHFVTIGWREGLSPSPYFNSQFYLENYPDIKNCGVNTLIHYVQHGRTERRLTNDKGIYRYYPPDYTEEIKNEISNFEKRPMISILMPVYNVSPQWLEKAINSLTNQWYTIWELCIVDDFSTNVDTITFLKSLNDDRIRVRFNECNMNISYTSNEAMNIATGEYIALMDNDDELSVDALFEVVKLINAEDADFIYSDEDKIDTAGIHLEAHFKSDFNYEMLLSQNYISHLSVIRKSIVDDIKGFELGLEGAQDHDLYLKIVEKTNRIIHIPKVLYHWRKIPGSTADEHSEKSYAQEAGKRAVENALRRRKISGSVSNQRYPGTYDVKYEIVANPLVSIIIPFRDCHELLETCIKSIINKTEYENYEIIAVNNKSEEEETAKVIKQLEALDQRISFHSFNKPFNYSEINNHAVREWANGSHILLLNNDMAVMNDEWLESMLGYSQRLEIGAVGAMLFYPDDTIQHAGVIIGIGGVAGHSHKYLKKEEGGYFYRPWIAQNLSAVTAACLMVKKSLYLDLGGLNDVNLPIAFNDIDFCLRCIEKAYRNVYVPRAQLYHYESISRGSEDTPEKQKRFINEVKYMKKRHRMFLEKGDPCYNINLTLNREDFTVR
jgi:GT2 family glycosyltransferase